MEVLTVGGGVFGIATALRLARDGHDVTLYEKRASLLSGASDANQFRLHRGYHYPRSRTTARECRDSQRRFRETFPEAVVDSADHYYCIASERSKTGPAEFLDHCDALGFPYERTDHPIVRSDRVALTVQVPEARVDPVALCDTLLERLRDSSVRVRRNRRARPADFSAFDRVVLATYARTNELLPPDSSLRRRFKFELCEKPLVDLPPAFADTSTVVMDGPFMCYDPYGRSDQFLLGNVEHAVHHRTVGETPAIPEEYRGLLAGRLVEEPPKTRIDRFREHGETFIPGLDRATHCGSFFTVRTVLAGVEASDSRLTYVDREGDLMTVFAGKLASCLPATDEIAETIEGPV